VILDISPRIGRGSPVWPGDTPLSIETAWSPESGDSVTVCRVTLSPHTGAHADAPLHVAAGPEDAASLALDPFWGPCAVVAVAGVLAIDRVAVERALVEAGPGVTRLLVRTQDAPLEVFPETFPHFTADGAAALAAHAGLVLVGIDTFSVDAPDSKELPAHRALFGAGLVILEGLDLSAVTPGRYELVALPLRLEGADASPVRAALRPLVERGADPRAPGPVRVDPEGPGGTPVRATD
jgi:arylformamidase